MEKFSVYQWFVDGQYERVETHVPAGMALRRAISLTTSVGGQLGTTTRVIVTDDGDSIAWEWIHGKGVVFPVDVSPKV